MESPESWLYLKVLSSAMIQLVQYYFTQWSPYHEAIRSAAIAIVFSGGLAWMGLLIIRSPFDRFKAVLGAGLILGLCAVFLSSSDKSSSLYMGNSSKGAPVANGSYWSYAIIGNIYSLMKSSIDSVFNAELAEYYGGIDGPQKQKLMIAYDDSAQRNAQAFEGTPAHQLYLDYMTKCNKAALDAFGARDSVNDLKGVGLMGSTRIAIDERDTNILRASATRIGEKVTEDVNAMYGKMYDKDSSWLTDKAKKSIAQIIGGVSGITAGLAEGAGNGSQLAEEKARGEERLRTIPNANNPFNGKADGYLIPTKAYWDKKKNLPASGSEFMDSRSDLGGKYLQAGLDEDVPVLGDTSGNAEVRKFYPKNCFDAYNLTEAAITAWRDSNAGDPKFKDSAVAGAYMATTAAQRMSERAQEEVKARIEAAGGTVPADGISGGLNSLADATYQASNAVFAEIAEWMLRYKVPMTIMTVAMLAAALLIAFPLFCVMAVFMGPGILWTYLKLLSLAFMVGFLNDLFLGMAANAISANSISLASDAGYLPGGGSLANDMAASGTKAVIFSALTVLEIVFAKVLIWDDVKAIGSFNPGSIGVDAASSGLQKIGGAAMAVATLGKSALAAKAAGSSLVSNTTSTLTNLGKTMHHTSNIMSTRPTQTGGFGSSAYSAAVNSHSALKSLVPQKPSGGGNNGGGNKGGGGGGGGGGKGGGAPSP